MQPGSRVSTGDSLVTLEIPSLFWEVDAPFDGFVHGLYLSPRRRKRWPMARSAKPPELAFQKHIADFLVREHGYGVLEQADITDTDHFIVEDHLWAFLNATQADQIKKLVVDYGTDAREEVFRALRKELEHTPLWMILRHGLEVRGIAFRLYYPKPRSPESAAAKKYGENRITVRPHFYFGDANTEIDFVLFLNGLPIVALEVKHEKNQNVHDAVAQFAGRDHSHRIFQHPFLYLAADTSDAMAAPTCATSSGSPGRPRTCRGF